MWGNAIGGPTQSRRGGLERSMPMFYITNERKFLSMGDVGDWGGGLNTNSDDPEHFENASLMERIGRGEGRWDGRD